MRDSREMWWNDRFVPWEDAQTHITSETAMRGLNVFEGLRAYWQGDQGSFGIVGLSAHLERLQRSAATMRIRAPYPTTRWREAIIVLLRRVPNREDLYLRPTIYVERGAYETDPSKTEVGAFISWRPAPHVPHRSLACGVSNWVRIPSRCLPAHAKIGAAYTAFRMARLEIMDRGWDEAILLNEHGQVAETGGGSVFCVYGSTVHTPPLDGDILPSITRRIVLETLCPHLGIQVRERPLEPSDLAASDELFIAGTLDGITRVHRLDERPFDVPEHGSAVRALQDVYHTLCLGLALQDSDWVETVDPGGA